jgi:integrase
VRDSTPSEREARSSYGSKGSVYAYETAQGTRWRYMFRRTDGKQTSKRGFTSERAAREALRRPLEQIERGEIRHTDQTFGAWWERWLRRRRPYLEPNAYRAYEVDGRLRLRPAFGQVRLDRLEVEQVRAWMESQAEAVESGEVAAKTVNNALGALVVCLNAAVKDRVIATNPALGVDRLPRAHVEHEYLRLHEIPVYLDACLDVYRPLAEVLLGAGLRISEAIALQVGDISSSRPAGSSGCTARRRRPGPAAPATDRRRATASVASRSVDSSPGCCRSSSHTARKPLAAIRRTRTCS